MSYITFSKDELINEINMLKMKNTELRQELAFYKEDNKIKEKYDIDYTHMEAILGAIPSAIVIVDAEGKLSYLNKRAIEIFGFNYLGFERGDVYAKEKAFKLDGTPYLLEEMPVSYSLKYGQEVRNKYMIMQRADGKQIQALVSSSPLFDDKGKVTSAVSIFEDITELKVIEKSLIDSKEILKTILENANDSICMQDLKTGRYIYMNPGHLKMSGYTEYDINSISDEERHKLVHPDDRDILDEIQKKFVVGLETFFDVEYRSKVKSGEYRWFSVRRNFLRDEKGQAKAVVNITHDITEKKEYEKKLALQAKILSNINDAISVVDENDIIIYCNKAFTKLFGWQELELVGRSFFNFAQGCVYEVSKEKILWSLVEGQKAYGTADENYLYGIKCCSKDGTQIIVDINRTVVKGPKGEFKGYIFSIRDVSERYKYELQLRKSEEKYRYLFNSIDEGLAIIELIFDKENKPVDFRYIELNPAFMRQTGLKNMKILGKTAKELKFEIEGFWYETYCKVALTGEPIRLVNEVKGLNKWFEVYLFKIDLEKSNRVGVLFKDITEDVMHNRKLGELIKMQDDLYVNVSHELKTPLNVIFSANQVIDMYLKSDSIEAKKEKLINYNNSIKQNCYRLIKLINNIVDLSKSNNGLLNLNLYNVNIVEVIESIVQSVSEYVKSKELKIIFDTNVEEKIIVCDPDKIERIMLNLISNAIKFSKQSGEIYVSVLSKKEIVEISVKDTGIGIEKQNLDNIFNRFYKEDKGLSRNAEGSGVGLSLIKSLVELQGGNMSVESEINKGSIFKFEIPVRTIEGQEYIKETNYYSSKIETIKIEFSDIYSIN